MDSPLQRRQEEAQDIVYQALIHMARMKLTLIDRLLAPANVPAQVYETIFVYLPDGVLDLTYRQQAASEILAAIMARPDGRYLIDALVALVARWHDFEISENPTAAQAVTRRAWRLLEHKQVEDSLTNLRAELSGRAGLAAHNANTGLTAADPLSPQESGLSAPPSTEQGLLLRMWQDVPFQAQPARQAVLMRDLLNRLFLLHEVILTRRFSASPGNDQVEGVLQWNGKPYPVVCRWRAPQPVGPQSSLSLTSDDLTAILTDQVSLRDVLRTKVRAGSGS